ncbi:putative Ferritin-like superfamily [Septoria linicola]|nr:putative Ferritin-like superfamily [Septoria linicola]
MHATIIASLAALAVAAPAVEKRQAAPPPAGVNDATILQYALTLEHLENAFYREGLQKFKQADFVKAGLAPSFYNNLQQIKKDEQVHVDFLSAGLTAAGAQPVAECRYNFGFKDVPTFLAIANVLEGVGISAYLGAAKYIDSPDYLTAAGSILTIESRHSAYLRENQNPAKSPFPSPFDTPLEFSNVKSLAAPFITGCPTAPSSLTLLAGFQAFPTIAVTPAGVAKSGATLSLKVAKKVAATNAWFITSAGAVPARLTGSGSSYKVVVPTIGVPNLQPGTVNAGQGYLVLTKDANKPTDDNTVAGPAVIDLADNAFGRAADKATYGGSSYKAPAKPKGY